MRFFNLILITISCTFATAHSATLHDLDLLLQRGIADNIYPGAVACIYHRGKNIYHKAFGHYTYDAHSPHITKNTLFDVASLTKLMTVTCAMLLYDQGKLKLDDPVQTYLPACISPGKQALLIRHLLTHTSGLDDKAILAGKRGDDFVARICASKLRAQPGTTFLYNDSDMLLLQAIVEAITQQPFEQFVHKHILKPLGMQHTLFLPSNKKMCAPTRAAAPGRTPLIQGEVDDDRAYLMGGIAGHAGLFSTAHDFAQYMIMLVHDGAYTVRGKKKQFLSPQTVREWTTSHCDFTAYDEKGNRGYGFEIGRHLSARAFGHFGWSGTSVWAERERDLVCVLFTNSIYPSYDGRDAMKAFRVQFHQLVTQIIPHKITTGAEQTDLYLPLLRNKRVAILTNHTACIGTTHLVDKLRAEAINIVKIFTPEHGFRGTVDAEIIQHDSVDKKTGIPLISLYGPQKKPSTTDLADVDIIIFDIQDVGVRCYTYISSLQYLMEAAAENNKPLIVLDRPNPNGFYVDGPLCEVKSFVGMQPIPLVHGMTVGEYAQMLNGEQLLANKVSCGLTVIPCSGYCHQDSYTLPIFPSPNLKTMNAIYLYPSLCLFEGTKMSLGHGTPHPYEMFGHPALPKTEHHFIPRKPADTKVSGHLKYAGQTCHGYDLRNHAETPQEQRSKQLSLTWLQQAHAAYPHKEEFFTKFFPCLAGNKQLAEQIKHDCSEQEIRASWEPGLSNFKKTRKKYLLYEDFEE